MAAPTAIIYDGNRLIPAPRLSFSTTHRRSADHSGVGTESQVVLSGELVGCKGWDFSGGGPAFYTGSNYPDDDANTTCNKFANLVEMKTLLGGLFSIAGDYKWFEIVGCEGLVEKWRARPSNLEFPEGKWTDIVPYNITLELQQPVESATPPDDIHIDHTETWGVQFDEENGGIYTLSHALSCQSEETIDNTSSEIVDGWKNAKTWMDTRLAGTDYTGSVPSTIKNDFIFGSDGFGLTDYTAYNYTVQRSLDEFGGTYSVTETWTLAKDPVFRTWTVAFENPRDDYSTVSIEGEFKSLLDRTATTETAPTNGSAALTAYNTWESGSGPYTEANQQYVARGGCGTLGSCPVNKTVTITEESRGDDTAVFGDATRTVQFVYEFSDAENDAEVSITRTSATGILELCETKVTISGQIQGHVCGCATTKLANAVIAYGNINCATQAAAVYSGSGTLIETSSSYAENERDGTIDFTCEFTDRLDGSGIQQHAQTVATKIDEQDCCSEVTVGGTITPYCTSGQAQMVATGEAAWDAIRPTLVTTAGAYCSQTAVLRSSTVNRNLHTGEISYTYIYRCCNLCVEGAFSESINITKEFPADVVAIVPVLGRTCGPVIQSKGTKTVEKCTIAIDLLFAKVCVCSYAKPAGLEATIQGIISSAGCCTGAYNTHTERDTESWNPRTGRYTRNVTTICECC